MSHRRRSIGPASIRSRSRRPAPWRADRAPRRCNVPIAFISAGETGVRQSAHRTPTRSGESPRRSFAVAIQSSRVVLPMPASPRRPNVTPEPRSRLLSTPLQQVEFCAAADNLRPVPARRPFAHYGPPVFQRLNALTGRSAHHVPQGVSPTSGETVRVRLISQNSSSDVSVTKASHSASASSWAGCSW